MKGVLIACFGFVAVLLLVFGTLLYTGHNELALKVGIGFPGMLLLFLLGFAIGFIITEGTHSSIASSIGFLICTFGVPLMGYNGITLAEWPVWQLNLVAGICILVNVGVTLFVYVNLREASKSKEGKKRIYKKAYVYTGAYSTSLVYTLGLFLIQGNLF